MSVAAHMGPSRDQSLLICPASISVSVMKYPDKTKFDGKGLAQISRLQSIIVEKS